MTDGKNHMLPLFPYWGFRQALGLVVDDFIEITGDEKENPPIMDDSGPKAAMRTHILEVPLTGYEPQPIEMSHCVQSVQIDKIYGEFQLRDAADRVIATSKLGRMSLLKKDLVTDVGRVWHDALARTSEEYRFLHEQYQVDDPGLDLGGLKPLRLQFLQAPKHQLRYVHIPVSFRITCVWDSTKFSLVEK